MRYTTMLLAAATILGCGGDSTGPSPVTPVTPVTPVAPVTPVTPVNAPAWMWGMVLPAGGGYGTCIVGATVRLVTDQGEGQQLVQESCEVIFGGFTYPDLTPGVAITIRASAPGYATKDTTFVPSTNSYQTAMLIVLSRP
jgi:hypothetical protein